MILALHKMLTLLAVRDLSIAHKRLTTRPSRAACISLRSRAAAPDIVAAQFDRAGGADQLEEKLRALAAALAWSSGLTAPGIEIPGGARGLAALPFTLGVADGSGRVWGCCAQLAEAVGAS